MTASPRMLSGGRYRRNEPLAVGGMGEIWRGEDTVLQRPVAIKVLRADYAGDPDFRERFRDEARHAALLTQPNVTQVFDFVDDEAEEPCIVMEYVAGEPLAAILDREGPLDADKTWSILGQTAAALGAAHRMGIVHRDIKPGNILVCPSGLVKVTDFGIARAFDETTGTHPEIVLGTVNYLAPERLAGEHATPASDLYALGVVGYECLTGKPPFEGDTPDVLRAHQLDDPPALPATVPSALADLVTALMAKDPADRPSDAAAIESQARRMASPRALERHVGDETPVQPYPAEPATSTDPRVINDPVTQVLTAAPATSVPAPRRVSGAGRDLLSTGRRHPTALAVAGIVVLLLAATLLANRLLSTGPSRGQAAAAPTNSRSASPAAKPVAVSGVTLVGGSDHPEELHYVTDSSRSTAWFTEHYSSAAFGNLRSGLGLQLRTSPSSSVKRIVITFADPGIAARLYAGNGASASPHGKPLATTSSAPVTWRVTLPTAQKAQSLLIWITRLVPDSGGYRAGVADVQLLG